jgi:hypothetical protein
MTTKTFKKGDFVRINDRTHDERMPATRMGHLVERVSAAVHYSNKEPVATHVWSVFMTNGAKLKFHEMYMEHVDDI